MWSETLPEHDIRDTHAIQTDDVSDDEKLKALNAELRFRLYRRAIYVIDGVLGPGEASLSLYFLYFPYV